MKKFLSIALVVLMMLACAVTVSAANNTTITGPAGGSYDATINVTAGTAATVYHVYIVWEDLNFTYSAMTWDPETHTYKAGAGGAWTPASATVKVENHSNTDVTVSVDLDKTQADNQLSVVNYGVTVAVDKESVTLESADADAYRGTNNDAVSSLAGYAESGDQETFTVTVTGTPTGIPSNTANIATITLTITAA